MEKRFSITIITILSIFIFACSHKSENKNAETKAIDPIAAITEEIKKDDDNANLYNKRAKLYIAASQINNALSDINKAIQIDDKNTDYYLTLSDIYFATVQIDKCKEAIEKAIKIDDKKADAFLKLAELNLYLKKYDETHKNADKAISIDNNSAQSFFIKGFAYKENGDSTKAVANFIKATTLNPEHYDAFMQLGLMFSRRNNKLAVDYFNSALNLKPKSIEAYYALAMFQQENGKADEATKAYKSILSINPSYKEAYFNLGYIQLEIKKNYPEALKYFSDAIKTDNEFAEAYYNRGYTYELMKEFESARADYKKARDLKVNYQKAIDGLNRLDKK